MDLFTLIVIEDQATDIYERLIKIISNGIMNGINGNLCRRKCEPMKALNKEKHDRHLRRVKFEKSLFKMDAAQSLGATHSLGIVKDKIKKKRERLL